MSCQHNDAFTNLLDFTESATVAMYFACRGSEDKDGWVIIKHKDTLDELSVEKNTVLPDDRNVLIRPQKKLRRAKDQEGILVHSPRGFLPFKDENIVVIKHEWKKEILEYLKNIQGISYEKLFYDMRGVIEQQKREYEKLASATTQSIPSSQGFAKPKDNQTAIIMESYVGLLRAPAQGPQRERLKDHAKILVTRLTDVLERNSQDAETYFNRAFVHHSKPTPDYTRAIADYTRAIELNPNYLKAYSNRSSVYIIKPNPEYDLAISDISYVLELNPNLGEAYFSRGVMHTGKPSPDYEQAILDYTRGLELIPNVAEMYYNRAVAYADKPDPDYERSYLRLHSCDRIAT